MRFVCVSEFDDCVFDIPLEHENDPDKYIFETAQDHFQQNGFGEPYRVCLIDWTTKQSRILEFEMETNITCTEF